MYNAIELMYDSSLVLDYRAKLLYPPNPPKSKKCRNGWYRRRGAPKGESSLWSLLADERWDEVGSEKRKSRRKAKLARFVKVSRKIYEWDPYLEWNEWWCWCCPFHSFILAELPLPYCKRADGYRGTWQPMYNWCYGSIVYQTWYCYWYHLVVLQYYSSSMVTSPSFFTCRTKSQLFCTECSCAPALWHPVGFSSCIFFTIQDIQTILFNSYVVFCTFWSAWTFPIPLSHVKIAQVFCKVGEFHQYSVNLTWVFW